MANCSFFYLKAHEVLSDRKAGISALLAGASLGYSALTQPALLLLPVCFPLFSTLANGWRRRTFICVLAAGCGVVAVLTPWLVRNFIVLHDFVPITTAGGQNLFIVTDPRSDGRYDGQVATEWWALSADEVVRYERSVALGINSIRDYPLHYFSTSVKKPFYLFGQDIKNVYWNLGHEEGKPDMVSEEHPVVYWISNGFYLAIILLISITVMKKQYLWDTTPRWILLWIFMLYLIFPHSLLLPEERYHHAAWSFMAIFAAMALVPARREHVDSAGSLSLFRANPAKSARGSRSRAFEHPGAVKRAGATRLPAADWRFSVA